MSIPFRDSEELDKSELTLATLPKLYGGRRRPFLCSKTEARAFGAPASGGGLGISIDLAIHAIFGHLLFLSDQYLLESFDGLRMLDDEQSLLREMLNTGFAKIFTLEPTLGECIALPEVMDLNEDHRRLAQSVWPRTVKTAHEMERLVRLPRRMLALGFSGVDALKNDARVVEFRRLSPESFKRLSRITELDEETNKVDSFYRTAILEQIELLKLNEQLFAPSTTDMSPVGLPLSEVISTFDRDSLFSMSLHENLFWHIPILEIGENLKQSDLAALKPLVVATSKSHLVKKKIRFARNLGARLGITRERPKPFSMDNLHRSLRSYLCSVVPEKLLCDLIVKSTATEIENKIRLRDIIPAILAAAQ